ncbi:MAG: peptidylprolyl isomerase [Gammaproteobacteria bacterium]|nr:peptidylprolyl isomerase [Gammaproteobacteria bacterium]
MTHRISFSLSGLLCGLLLIGLPAAIKAKQIEELDQIIAVVNDDIITRSELDRHISLLLQQLKGKKTKLPPKNIIQKQVLERMIIDKIQVQQAERRGIRINDETINRVIENIARDNKLTVTQFRKVLEKDGISFAEFRENMREQMLSEQLRKTEIERLIHITPQEIDNYLARSAKSGDSKTEYRLRQIIIDLKEGASPEQVEAAAQKADAALQKIRRGAEFSQVAIEASDGQDALQGGDMGWLKAGQLPNGFIDIVLGMKPGDTSQPLRSAKGFLIVHLEATRNTHKSQKVKQALVRHILIRTDQLVSDTDARQRLEKLRSRIVAGEDFAKLAQLNSDDKASAVDGGSLGWVGAGRMVPEFEKVMDNAKQGEVSEPFRSRFGWHIVQVMSRRTQDNSLEHERLQAHNQLRQRKANEALENWLRQIRDEAYVEYRLNN